MQVPTPPEKTPPDGGETTEAGPTDGLRRLVDLVARLRAPDGCPWDREQGLTDLRAYLLEEAHEAAAAIDTGDWDELAAELGDLVFLAAFVTCVAEEAGAFTVEQVVERAARKIIDRHPHVFGGEKLEDADAVRRAWEERKAEQKKPDDSLLAGVPASLPALVGAYRLTQKAAGVGFDWDDAGGVLDKVEEEIGELRAALGESRESGRASAEAGEELGDLLFTVANLCRKLKRDPEATLAAANLKFRRRFARMERGLTEAGRSLTEASLEEMEALWQAAKSSES
jgi:nucleoside triphosphate diphosphatase